MKKTVESSVAETVKLCIELDKEMEKQWKQTKEDLEDLFKYAHGKTISLSNNTLFRCLLYCYDRGWSESIPLGFIDSFSKKEVEVMLGRKVSN